LKVQPVIEISAEMFDAFDLALLGAGLFYLVFSLWLLLGVHASRRLRESERHLHRSDDSIRIDDVMGKTPTVSVIIAARDEAASIERCLNALSQQDFGGRLQTIVVDDGSTDGTAALAQRFIEHWPHEAGLQVLDAPSPSIHEGPKKSALAGGIAASDGELLLFTDADCMPPPGWVSAMVTHFDDPRVGLVAGYADRDARGLAALIQAVDDLGMGALAEGGIGHGVALSCTGRSLAYRRRVYDEVGGFDAIGHLISGDDVYFFRHVASESEALFRYCAEPWAVVTESRLGESLSARLSQKTRHASKASRYEGGARWLGVAVYLYHVILAIGLVQVGTGAARGLFLVVWGLRWTLDFALMWTFAPRAEDRRRLLYLPFAEFLYIPYVVLLVPVARILGFRWRHSPPTSSK